jgi:hypothetical protein
MAKFLPILQVACALAAAAILGNWFLLEARKAKKMGKPWYAPYLSTPGIIILLIVVLLPLIVRNLK